MSDQTEANLAPTASPEVKPVVAPDRGPRLVTVLLVLVVLNALAVFLVWKTEPQSLEEDHVTAQLFLDGLVFGIADAPDRVVTGYSIAYDQLSESARAKWDYAGFSEHFENKVAESGYLVSWVPLSGERGSLGARYLAYRLDFEGRDDEPLSFHCELKVIPFEGQHRIDSWKLRDLKDEER
ncbi:MAG: hypothetical protein V3W41_21460 [Planctomycetota bacterium]